MQYIYIKYMFRYIRKKWWVVLALVGIFILLFLYIANSKIRDEVYELEQYSEVDAIATQYDDAIATTQSGLEIVEQQVEEYQKYLDNSIFMNLDSQGFYVSSIQYVVNGENIKNVMAALLSYINEGSLLDEMAIYEQDISVEYLQEIISCSVSENILNVSVMHFEQDKAEYFSSVIEQFLFEHKEQIAEIQGEFEMNKLDSSSCLKADINVLNTQSSYLTNIKSYKSNLSDFERKLADQRVAKQTYVENQMPEKKVTIDTLRTRISYAIIGLFIGVILSCILIYIWMLSDDRIKNKKDLHFLGVNILNTIQSGENNFSEAENFCLYLQKIAESFGIEKFFVSNLGECQKYRNILECYKECLEKNGLQFTLGQLVLESVDDVAKMLCSGNCIMIIQIGNTTYTELREQLSLCQRLKVPVLGSIVIE